MLGVAAASLILPTRNEGGYSGGASTEPEKKMVVQGNMPKGKPNKAKVEVLSGFRVSLPDGREGEVEFVATTGEALVNLDGGIPQQRPWFEETPREWIEGVWPAQTWTDARGLRVCKPSHKLRERKDVADYRHSLRCIRGHAEAQSTAELVEELGRPADWIQAAMARGMPQKPKHLEHWDPDGFCEVRYLKGLYHKSGLYESIAQGVEWEQDRVWRVHKETNGDWGLRTVKQCEMADCGRSLQRVPDSSVKVGPGDSSKPKFTQAHSSWSCRKHLDGCLKPDVQTPVQDMFYWWCPKHHWYVCQHCKKEMPDKPTSKQIRHWYRGECTALDDLVFKVVHDFNLPDPGATYGGTARYTVKMNWYPDGMAQVTDHRHDNWTILVSLGSPRVLNVDYARVSMEDGDVIVFGTQKHGVPVAAPSQGGRLSLVFMFAPDQHVEKASLHLAGRVVKGFERRSPSSLEDMHTCDNDAEDEGDPPISEEDIHSLCALGFTDVESEQALVACGGDRLAAANLLLSS